MAEVKPHVLRYWETEFSALRPKKNRAGNRTYRDRDVRLVLLIRQLLYDDGYTIKGARKKLSEKRAEQLEQIEIPFAGAPPSSKGAAPKPDRSAVKEIRQELEALLKEL